MKLKNVYKMGSVLSLFFGILPLLGFIVANVFAKFGDCEFATEAVVQKCAFGEIIYSLFVSTWFVFVTFPLGLLFAFVFWLLYLSVRRR